MKNKIIAYGKYSNSQNGVVVSVYGVAQCICSGGAGHDTTKPIILELDYEC